MTMADVHFFLENDWENNLEPDTASSLFSVVYRVPNNNGGMSALKVRQFKWPDYVVLIFVLAGSCAIGIFFGFFQGKKMCNDVYLLGGRQMGPIPVSMSLLTSFISSVTLLGHPVEIYLYGTQQMMVLIAFIPLTLTLQFVIVPLYFNLQLTSIYEYLEMRFNRQVRLCLSTINSMFTIYYMSMVGYGPALALSFVTGIHVRIFVAIIFIACIFYSTVGGFKAVLWTDTFQASIMLSTLTIVVFMGISNIDGGLSTIWKRAEKSDRINFFNFDPDPRTRHTFWTSVVGGVFAWLPAYGSQVQVQRYISLPTMRAVKIALTINLVGLWIVMGLTYLAGFVIFGTYYDCDPIRTKRVIMVDQLLPVFVMDTLGDHKGLPGFFAAGITCAALSTISSCMNALAACITEDQILNMVPKLTDKQRYRVSKITALGTGVVAYLFVFIAEQITSIFGTATGVLGILGGPALGTFMCGQFFPWANTVGAVGGIIASFGYMAIYGISAIVLGKNNLLPNQFLPLSISGKSCSNITTPSPPPTACKKHWKNCEFSWIVRFLSLSYVWYPAMGCLSAIFFQLIISFAYRRIFGTSKIKAVQSKLIYPVVLKMWVRLFPERIRSVVDFEEEKETKTTKTIPPSTPPPATPTASGDQYVPESTLKEEIPNNAIPTTTTTTTTAADPALEAARKEAQPSG